MLQGKEDSQHTEIGTQVRNNPIYFRAYWVPRSSMALLFIYNILVNRNRGRAPLSSCPDPLLQLAIVTVLDKVCQTVKVEAAAAVMRTRGRDNSVTELRDLTVWDWWSKLALSGATLHLIISKIVINFLITGVGRIVPQCMSADQRTALRSQISFPTFEAGSLFLFLLFCVQASCSTSFSCPQAILLTPSAKSL